MSPEILKGPDSDPLLEQQKSDATAAENADKKDGPEKPKKLEKKEQDEKPKDDVTKEGLSKIEERIAKQDVTLKSIKKKNPEDEVAAMRKRMEQKKEHLDDSDLAADLVTDTTTALQAPEGKTKANPIVPEGEDRQETQLAKGKEVDQKEMAKQVENPEAKPTTEVPKTEMAAVEQKADLHTEQNAQVVDASAAKKFDNADAAQRSNQGSGTVA